MRPLLTTLLLLSSLIVYDVCLAQNEKQSVSEQGNEQENRRRESAERRDRMQKFAAAVQFFEGSDREVGAQVVEQPILRFDDNVRANNDGTVWVWGRAGRAKPESANTISATRACGWRRRSAAAADRGGAGARTDLGATASRMRAAIPRLRTAVPQVPAARPASGIKTKPAIRQPATPPAVLTP